MSKRTRKEAEQEPVAEEEDEEEEPSGEDSEEGSSGSEESSSDDDDDSGPDVGDEDDEADSPDEDGEPAEKEINVNFEFFGPKEIDFLGLRSLLQTYLDGQAYDVSGLVDTIIKQAGAVAAVGARRSMQSRAPCAWDAGTGDERRQGPTVLESLVHCRTLWALW